MTKAEIMNYALSDHQRRLATALVDACPNTAIALMAIQTHVATEIKDDEIADYLDDVINKVADMEIGGM